jgi:hypothetical protein
MKRFIRMLRDEQEGIVNDLIRILGNQEEATKKLGNLIAEGWWEFDEDDHTQDKLVLELRGLTLTERPEPEVQPVTLPDGDTVLVGEVVLKPRES